MGAILPFRISLVHELQISLVDQRRGLERVSGAFASLLRRSRPPRLKRYADPVCRRAFVDDTRSRTRRWCDLGTCGNRARVRRHRNRSAGTA